MSDNNFGRKYSDLLPNYKNLTRKNHELLKELLDSNAIKYTSESRTKSLKSFLNKISRVGKSYEDPINDISDISGIRIILYSLSDIDKVVSIIKENFDIDIENSVDKSTEFEPDTFGYLSQHFIVKTNTSRKNLPEWKAISQYSTEIQVRTILQHSWASVNHFLLYKNESDIPKKLRRRLFRLSALFELADEEFNNIINDIKEQTEIYKKDFSFGKRIEINIESLKTYIQNSEVAKYWIDFLRETTKQKIDNNDWGDLSRDVRMANYFGITSINELEKLQKDAQGWGEEFFIGYYGEMFKHFTSPPNKIRTVINGPSNILMIAANAEKLDSKEFQKKFGYGFANLLIKNAKKVRGINE